MTKANKKNKKYDPMRLARKLQLNSDRVHLKTLAVGYVTKGISEDYQALLIDFDGVQVDISKSMADLISRHAYKWSVYLCVFGFNGERYTKSKVIICPGPLKQSDLVNFLNDEHQEMIRGFNPAHLVGAGWIAQPYAYDFSEKQAFDIFEKLGAWEHVGQSGAALCK